VFTDIRLGLGALVGAQAVVLSTLTDAGAPLKLADAVVSCLTLAYTFVLAVNSGAKP
jgi:hypothetical protein